MTPGPYEARHIPGGVPTNCCDFGIVSLSAGREVCRVWEQDDAEHLAMLLNGTPAKWKRDEIVAKAKARIAKSQVRHGDKIAYPADMEMMLDLVGLIQSLEFALSIEQSSSTNQG